MLAIDLDAAKNLAVVIVGATVTLAVLAAIVVKVILSKLITVAVLAGLSVLVWSERVALQDCAARVREDWAAGASADTSCAFLGQDVSVPR